MGLKSYKLSSTEPNIIKKVLSNSDRLFYATGGTITKSGDYIVHTFTGDGTFTANIGTASIEYLIVAGGGGGGMDMGGGGGAGGVIIGSTIISKGTYTITVGAAGVGAPAAGTNGQPGSHQYTISATKGINSTFNNLTAIGGGFGASSYYGYLPNYGTGGTGGSGGGNSGYSDGNIRAPVAGTSGQGNNGGQGGGQYYSGGGGGAGSQGADSTNQPNGGNGIVSAILGTSYFWGGGGGGASYSLGTGGNGGNGGGGGGAVGTTTGGAGLNNGSPGGGGSPNSQTNTPGGNAGSNTGGGGGGGSHYNANNKGGNGGSGIVIIRYKSNNSIPIDSDPYVNLTFTASGNLTVTGNGSKTVSIFKTSGSAWDTQAYITTPFTAPCTIEFNKEAASGDNGASYAMMSWNADPTADASYSSLDYASYPYATSAYYIYHNGTGINPGTSWSTANKFYIVYGTDGFIRHYNGSTLLYSVNYGTGNTVYVDSSFYSPNGTYGGFSNIKVATKAWNGTSYT